VRKIIPIEGKIVDVSSKKPFMSRNKYAVGNGYQVYCATQEVAKPGGSSYSYEAVFIAR